MSTTFSKFLDSKDHALQIRAVLVTGTPIDLTNIDSAYHWQMHLAYEAPESSHEFGRCVLIDMAPLGADGRTGVLVVASKNPTDHDYPGRNCKALFRARTLVAESETNPDQKAGTTVADVLALLREKKRDRFVFDDTGSGCRHWAKTVLGDLEERKIVEQGSREDFLQYCQTLHEKTPLEVPMPWREGKFY